MATRKVANFFKARDAWEKQFVIDCLTVLKGNIMKTAEAVGLSRRALQLKIQAHGVNAEKFRPAKPKRAKATRPKKAVKSKAKKGSSRSRKSRRR